VIGAWALGAWGRARATLDLDFLVMLDEEDLPRLEALMAQKGMVADAEWQESNPMLRGSQIRFQFQGVVVDVLRPRDAHDRQLFRRRRRKRLDGRYYWLVAPEDFILQKLKVGRPRDFEDALSALVRLRGSLDRRYLLRLARRLGLSGQLDYLLAVPEAE
jgi:hypothetical protein